MRTTTNPNRIRQITSVLVLALAQVALRPATAAELERANAVSLYLNVETKGKLISGLTQQNFRLYQDGESQPFRLEKPEEPASVALLVENSRISWSYYFDDINAAMEGFLRHAPDGNWYALATYSHALDVRMDFTKQTGRVAEAFFSLGPDEWNEIDTYDAVYEMLDTMGRLPGRKILIVIGSGFDTFSKHKLDDIKKKVESENVTIFVAGLGSVLRTSYDPYLDTSSRMNLLQAQAFLRMLAEKSGGFAWFPNHSNGFPDVLLGMMQSIATQYRLVYDTTAPGSGKFRKIKVEAFRVVNDKRENFDVLVREGWR
jgi:VWFA-related protein